MVTNKLCRFWTVAVIKLVKNQLRCVASCVQRSLIGFGRSWQVIFISTPILLSVINVLPLWHYLYTWHGISFKEEASHIARFHLLILWAHESCLWDSHIFVRVTLCPIKLIYLFIICASNLYDGTLIDNRIDNSIILIYFSVIFYWWRIELWTT